MTGAGVGVGVGCIGALRTCGDTRVASTGASSFLIAGESLLGGVVTTTDSFLNIGVSVTSTFDSGRDVTAVSNAVFCCLLEARSGKAEAVSRGRWLEDILPVALLDCSSCGLKRSVLELLSIFWFALPLTGNVDTVTYG